MTTSRDASCAVPWAWQSRRAIVRDLTHGWVPLWCAKTDRFILERLLPPGGAHAEIVALNAAHAAHASTNGATLYSTLEPCSHIGRTGACTTAIIDAGISTVVSGIQDPDPRVAGRGFAQLESAGIAVVRDVCADEITTQLRPYIHHRTTGRPFVRLKMACTMDARTTLPDGQKRITGDEARVRVHELRADSDVIITGMGTVRTDDPLLTVRDCDGESPRRIVLVTRCRFSARARAGAAVRRMGWLID